MVYAFCKSLGFKHFAITGIKSKNYATVQIILE